jgi:type 1 fimbria pilin
MIQTRWLIFIGCLLSAQNICASNPSNLTVNFAATIKENTCNVYIADNSSGSGAAASAEIKFSSVSLDKIVNNDSSAQKSFTLKMDGCTPGLTKLTTTIKSTVAVMSNMAIGNTTSGGAQDVGVQIARDNAPTQPFTINSTTDSQRLVWTSSEISSGLVTLRATLVAGNAPTLGSYQGIATFETSYE